MMILHELDERFSICKVEKVETDIFQKGYTFFAKTSVLVVATYDTDYLFVKKEKFDEVKEALVAAKCEFV